MKRIIVLAMIMVTFFSSTCFAKRGHGHVCSKQSFGMKPADAVIWTMANPNECGMDFLVYSREIKNDFDKLTISEKRKGIMKKLIQKHVDDLEKILTKKVVYTYSGAFDYEEYYQTLIFFKKNGYKTSIDEIALRMHLQSRYKEACEHIVSVMRGNKKEYPSNESYMQDVEGMMKKWGLVFQDFGTTEVEMKKLAKK